MGMLRLFLAISVLVAHTGPIFGLNLMFSDVAVKLFFIISGFYMSLVLSGKYEGGSLRWTFYSNRFLRLYPAFLLVTLTSLGVFLAAEFMPNAPERSIYVSEIVRRFSGAHGQLGGFSLVALMIPNIMIVGSDIAFLFHHSVNTGWEFTFGILAHYPGAVRGGSYLLNPPAWSIGIELWFYLLVPTLSRAKTPIIILLAAASLALRLWMDWKHPWITYFFFPAALCFFLYGMLAHRFWASSLFKSVAIPSRVWAIAGCGLALLMLREFIPGYRNHPWMIYTVAVFSLPFVFQAFKNIRWDRWVGNMSYPVYLFHTVIIAAVYDFLGSHSTPLIIGLTLAVSIVVNFFVEEPLERFRQRRASKQKSAGISGSDTISPAGSTLGVEESRQVPVP
ncbi:MAG TPA: acyltransferase [Rhizomicrobium sp.]